MCSIIITVTVYISSHKKKVRVQNYFLKMVWTFPFKKSTLKMVFRHRRSKCETLKIKARLITGSVSNHSYNERR